MKKRSDKTEKEREMEKYPFNGRLGGSNEPNEGAAVGVGEGVVEGRVRGPRLDERRGGRRSSGGGSCRRNTLLRFGLVRGGAYRSFRTQKWTREM